jgi:hypothetical protein
MDGVDKKMHKMAVAALIFGVRAMNEEPTPVIIRLLPAERLADLRPPTPPIDTPPT